MNKALRKKDVNCLYNETMKNSKLCRRKEIETNVIPIFAIHIHLSVHNNL